MCIPTQIQLNTVKMVEIGRESAVPVRSNVAEPIDFAGGCATGGDGYQRGDVDVRDGIGARAAAALALGQH